MTKKAALFSILFWLFSPVSQAEQKTFFHPGVFISYKQLQFVRYSLTEEPWQTAYVNILKDNRAQLSYKPTAHKIVECGPFSKPDIGCTDETRDSQAAYTQAILWRLTGDARYAENVRNILNAWANTLTEGHTNSNAPLQAAWAAQMFTRAAEIIKYSYKEWPPAEKYIVSKWLTEQYLPNIRAMFNNKCNNSNWHASGIEAMANIAVFTDNQTLFTEAIYKWRGLVNAYIYLTSDGPRPNNPVGCSLPPTEIEKKWYYPATYIDGLALESCRDFEHTAYGLAAIINVAETARLQGIDLYQDQESLAEERLTKAMELHSSYENRQPGLGRLCKNSEHFNNSVKGTFEVGFNHYSMRLGMNLPQTEQFLKLSRPTKGYFHYLWETLTHGLTGDVR
ncbi:alginate lyase family protein [Aeromonas sp. 604176]|uniref:alginate lyase family protein n=1 Tax=Aeromonas sp. 604176 TaxID=2712052 RepID=UPI003BA3C86A